MFSNGRQALAILGAALALALVMTPRAHAQGLFEALFGGRRSSPPPVQAFTAPIESLVERLTGDRGNIRSEPGVGYASYCVRTCDGAHFPLQRNANPAELCNSFCPAAKTKVFSGNNIDTAVAGDGSRYADLDNAFVYRQKLSADCTCNGKTPWGVAKIDAANDPTLRPGDIVATPKGLVAFNGSAGAKEQAANFTPVSNYGQFSPDTRAKLSELRVMPVHPPVPAPMQATSAPANDLRQPVLDISGGVYFTR